MATQILEYDSFSDIEFNPQKSVNCRAKAAAIYVGLFNSGKLDEALKSKEDFLDIVYNKASDVYNQLNLFNDNPSV